jgi:parallel beta-helix repeat protein
MLVLNMGKSSARTAFIAVALASVILTSCGVGISETGDPLLLPGNGRIAASALVPHEPIRINSNEDFDANHGVSSGDGSPSNPWIIENYDINGTGHGYCVYVGNTTEHFALKNSRLYGASGVDDGLYYPDAGVTLHSTRNVTLEGNNISNNGMAGIFIDASSEIDASSNYITENQVGAYIYRSGNNTLTNNTMGFNAFFGINAYESNCNDLSGNEIWGGWSTGMHLFGSHWNKISANRIMESYHAIELNTACLYNEIAGNKAWNLTNSAVRIYEAHCNTLRGNTISWSMRGIEMIRADNNLVLNNSVMNNRDGLMAHGCLGGDISGNEIADSGYYNGITLENCVGMGLSGNRLDNNSIGLDLITYDGCQPQYWNTHSIDATNIVNGKPVYYYKDSNGLTVPEDAGEVILANCTRCLVSNLTIENGTIGILLGFSSSNTITHNVVKEQCLMGIGLTFSANNIIFENDIRHSVSRGRCVQAVSSSGNSIFHNNFYMASTNSNAYETDSANTWDAGYPEGGNHWSLFAGPDLYSGASQNVPGSDGIGDHGWCISSNTAIHSIDYYPLMTPFSWAVGSTVSLLIPIAAGWNLISVSLDLNALQLPDQILDGDTKWDRAMWYNPVDVQDHWKQFYSVWSWELNDLNRVETTMGIWLNVTDVGDGFLNLTGISRSSTTIDLRAGWNLVGYPARSDSTYTVAQLKASTGATIVEGFDPGATYKTQTLADSYELQRGEGYWVFVPADRTWLVDW